MNVTRQELWENTRLSFSKSVQLLPLIVKNVCPIGALIVKLPLLSTLQLNQQNCMQNKFNTSTVTKVRIKCCVFSSLFHSLVHYRSVSLSSVRLHWGKSGVVQMLPYLLTPISCCCVIHYCVILKM